LLEDIMAHYAYLDENNVVTQVTVGKDEGTDGVDWEAYYGAKRTSYNGNIRKNYAGIGYTYDPIRDAFIPPKPYASWLLNETTCRWDAPVSMPTDGKRYMWDEPTLNWIEIT
jgi:hypothetical protein